MYVTFFNRFPAHELTIPKKLVDLIYSRLYKVSEQIFLAGEMPVEGSRGDAGICAQITEVRTLISTLQKHLHSAVKDPLMRIIISPMRHSHHLLITKFANLVIIIIIKGPTVNRKLRELSNPSPRSCH